MDFKNALGAGFWAVHSDDYSFIKGMGDKQKFDAYYERTMKPPLLSMQTVRNMFSSASAFAKIYGVNLNEKDAAALKALIDQLFADNVKSGNLYTWLEKQKTAAVNEKRYFDGLGSEAIYKYSQVMPKDRLDGSFIIFDAAICSKELLRVNGLLFEQIKDVKSEWFLCDWPPLGMKGEADVISLKVDGEFTEGNPPRVPFDRKIGWFPRCRVAGFFKAGETCELSVCLLLMQKPKNPKDHRVQFAEKLKEEIEEADASQAALGAVLV